MISKISDNLLDLHNKSFSYDYRRKALWYMISKQVDKNFRVLDAGCGTGFYSGELAKKNIDTVALEPDSRLIQFAEDYFKKKELQIKVVRKKLGLGKINSIGRFDRILCLDVLEHIENDFKALSELRSLLKENGKIVICVPSIPFLYGKKDKDLGHFRRYEKRSFLKLIQKVGLKVDSIRYWNLIGILPYLIFEKIIKINAYDNIRKPTNNIFYSVLRNVLYGILKIESFVTFLPLGLSLIAVCSKKSK